MSWVPLLRSVLTFSSLSVCLSVSSTQQQDALLLPLLWLQTTPAGATLSATLGSV